MSASEGLGGCCGGGADGNVWRDAKCGGKHSALATPGLSSPLERRSRMLSNMCTEYDQTTPDGEISMGSCRQFTSIT
jgi:hypothetical protein